VALSCEMLSNLHKLIVPISIALDADASTVASRLAAMVASVGFQVWVAYMADVIAILNGFSKSLQAADTRIVTVSSLVTTCVKRLGSMFPASLKLAAAATPALRDLSCRLGPIASEETEAAIVETSSQCTLFVKRLIDGIEARSPPET